MPRSIPATLRGCVQLFCTGQADSNPFSTELPPLDTQPPRLIGSNASSLTELALFTQTKKLQSVVENLEFMRLVQLSF